MSPPPAEQFAARIFLGPALRAQPDRRLVDLVRDGYDAAFEEIVRRYRRPLDRFAAAIVGGRSEDVTQDAFSKALLALRGPEKEIELRPWLYRIVRNTALNDLRDRGPATEALAEALPGGRSAAAEAEAREELAELMDRLRGLPEPQRAAIVMRELEGLSHEEIAAALGVTGGAARQAIFRARATLRDGLGLLVPLPLLRALADHGGEVAVGGAIAAGAGSAGGAALGGLGGGAIKAGMATLLVAGTVGAGVAIEHHRGNQPGPEQAEAAPLARAQRAATPSQPADTSRTTADRSGEDRHGSDDSHRSGSDSRHGSDENSAPSSRSHHDGSEDRSGSNSGSDEGSDNSGPGSTDAPDGDLSPAGGEDIEDSSDSESPISEAGPAGSVPESGESLDSSGSGSSGTSGSDDLATSDSSGSD